MRLNSTSSRFTNRCYVRNLSHYHFLEYGPLVPIWFSTRSFLSLSERFIFEVPKAISCMPPSRLISVFSIFFSWCSSCPAEAGCQVSAPWSCSNFWAIKYRHLHLLDVVLEQDDLMLLDPVISSVILWAVELLSRLFPSAKVKVLLQLIRQVSVSAIYGSPCHNLLLTIFYGN